MTQNAPAKINLGLHVLRRRDDGFHDIETVFLRIPWVDVLAVEHADDLSLSCSDETLPVDERNLVMQAAHVLRGVYRKDVGARMHLEKHIPYGAGLGGGSSDAAAALRSLNTLWQLGLDGDRLAEHALELGSDVPFFLGAECAYGSGRGEILEPLIDPDTEEPYRPPFALVVAVPEEQVSTAEAYAMVTPQGSARGDLRQIVLANDPDRWRAELVNDFQAPILEKYPAIASLRTALLDAGASYASLSGSGSAVYGFFEDDHAATAAAEALGQAGHRTWHGRL